MHLDLEVKKRKKARQKEAVGRATRGEEWLVEGMK